MIDAATYTIERAICDKAEAYARATMATRGPRCNFLTADEAKHPDYAACDNAMRGRVEQYEILTNPPERLFAYYKLLDSGIGVRVTTWTGDVLGEGRVLNRWKSNMRDRRASIRVKIGNATYSGTAFLDSGDYCRLRRVAAV